MDDIEMFEWIVRKEPLEEFIPKLVLLLKLLKKTQFIVAFLGKIY